MFGYTNEYQAHYYDFQTGYWADEDPEKCWCHGSGWALSQVDTWHRCPFHGADARHPEDDNDEVCSHVEVARCYIRTWEEKTAEDGQGEDDIPF